jgi:hypothetical protein
MNEAQSESYGLERLAARTGKSVDFYVEFYETLMEEDRSEAFERIVSLQSGLSLAEVRWLLRGPQVAQP